MQFKTICTCFLLVTLSCNNNANSTANKKESKTSTENKASTSKKEIPTNGNEYTQIKSIPLPEGYSRIENDVNSFAYWLENVSLKKDKTVYKFDGTEKYNQSAQFAVLDISVGKKDLQQCADAVMRLRAEYLFSQKAFDKIVFIDNANTVYKFAEPFTRENFTKYLDRVFGMCGSASLAKQLKIKTSFNKIQAGDVLIRGGFPGHAVIVMDVAQNEAGKRMYMIAQSYMPAQDIHVLQNPMNENLSPWYEVNENEIIQTPEYTFKKGELKEW
jgi:Domain of unknown function (4846)